jgi:glycosyltransferase involved in cell wall biosynthesis
MRLSILILTHNRPALFKRCLESVLAQIQPGVEVLVNNDSCDIEEIQHPQVTYHYYKPDTLSDIYKFLLEMSTGEYIYYLEDDDYLVDDFLEQELDADLTVGNYCPKYETPDMLTMMTVYKDSWITPADFLANLNTEHLQLSQHIYKRRHIDSFDFPKDSNIHNDIKLTIHAAHRAKTIKTVSKVFYYQTIDGGDNISFPKVAHA